MTHLIEPPFAEFEFEGGELRIRSPQGKIRIQPWPQPLAFASSSSEPWKQFRPEFRLLKPEMPSLLCVPPPNRLPAEAAIPLLPEATPSELKKAEAFNAFRAQMPGEVATAVENFSSHQWNLLDLVSLDSAALDLAQSNPVLAYLVANNDQFRQLVAQTPALQAQPVLSRKQRDLLEWLGFPAAEAVVRLLRKIVPEAISPHEARLFRQAIRLEPEIVKLLSHLRVINAGVLGLISNLKLFPWISPGLLCEVARSEPDNLIPRTADLLVDALFAAHVVLRHNRLPRFNSIASVIEFHDSVQDELARAEERRRAEAGQRRRRRRPSGGTYDGTVLSPAPIPGTEDFLPLTTRAELRAEGKAQHNCVGSYYRRVRSGTTAIYKIVRPERATLAIVHGPDGFWRRSELHTAHNGRVSAATRAAVDRWLAQYSLSV